MADNNTWLSPEERAALARQRELESARRAAVQNRTQTAPRAQRSQATARPAGTNPTQTNPRAQQRPQPGAAQPAGRPAVRGGMPSGVRQVQRSAHPTAPVRPGEATGDTKELPRYIHSAKRGGHKPPRRKNRTAPPVRIKLPPKVRAVLLAIAAVALIFIILMICGVRYTKDTRADGSTIKFFGIANANGIQNGWISADGARGRIADGNKITYSNGDVYEGGMAGLKKSGTGTYTYKNGDVYVGSFADDRANGSGTMTYANGNVYTGAFKDGQPDGEGTLTYKSGDTYVGSFAAGRKNGKGTYTSGDAVYTGAYVNDVREGEGKQVYANGDVYEGTFKNDMRNGQGTYTFANGERYVGSFRDNQLSGEGTYTWPSGKTYTGRFENGKIVEE